MQQTGQLRSGMVSSTARVYSYDGGGQILGRTDGTVSGTGSSATSAPLAGATTANPEAAAPQHEAKVSAMTDECSAAAGPPCGPGQKGDWRDLDTA